MIFCKESLRPIKLARTLQYYWHRVVEHPVRCGKGVAGMGRPPIAPQKSMGDTGEHLGVTRIPNPKSVGSNPATGATHTEKTLAKQVLMSVRNCSRRSA